MPYIPPPTEDDFEPFIIGYLPDRFGGQRGYRECWTLTGRDGQTEDVYLWENGEDVTSTGTTGIGDSVADGHAHVLENVLPGLFAEGFTLTGHEGPLSDEQWSEGKHYEPGSAAHVHFTDPRVRELALARYRLKTGGSRTDWVMLGKNHPDAMISEAKDWLRAAVAAGLLPGPDGAA